jgi:hypothetical protein
LFNLADDTAMIFRTKKLTVYGFALILLLRDFGLDTHLPTDENPAPKATTTCVHPKTVLNHLRECIKRHLAKEMASAAAHRATAPCTFVSAMEPPPPIEVLPFDRVRLTL